MLLLQKNYERMNEWWMIKGRKEDMNGERQDGRKEEKKKKKRIYNIYHWMCGFLIWFTHLITVDVDVVYSKGSKTIYKCIWNECVVCRECIEIKRYIIILTKHTDDDGMQCSLSFATVIYRSMAILYAYIQNYKHFIKQQKHTHPGIHSFDRNCCQSKWNVRKMGNRRRRRRWRRWKISQAHAHHTHYFPLNIHIFDDDLNKTLFWHTYIHTFTT